jgi:selenocysteine-specific elongation factor
LRHVVVGTAGHIDHGKSALVEALTGVHPDRLEEEKRRGITIDLGFADLDLAPDGVVSIVDVPGHERFVRHMVAGASGLDAAILLVAADDGVKPQTREHLAILSMLGLARGIVVLSKSDLAEPELRRVVASEIADLTRGTFLAEAPVIPVSTRSGEGLDELREALRGLCRSLPERTAAGVPRLPIDRSFVLKGFGTVVTGTLVSGTLREGQEVEILPGGRQGRVRGLQVHRRRVTDAGAGMRVAVNLQGLDCEEAPRGATVTVPGALRPTRRARVRVDLVESAPEKLRSGGPVHMHQGTCERAARLRAVSPGDRSPFEAELILREAAVLLPGDRFILRRPAPVDTVGGGVVLDAHPSRRPAAKRDGGSALLAASGFDRLVLAGRAGRSADELAAELGRSRDEFEAELLTPLTERTVIRAGGMLFDGGVWRDTGAGVRRVLDEFHESEPLRFGMTREALRGRAAQDMTREAFRDLLAELARERSLVLSGDRVAAAGFRVVLSPTDASHRERIESAFRRAGLDPPNPEDVLRGMASPSAARLLGLLVEEGCLVKIRDGRLFHADALQTLRRRLQDYARTSSTIDVGAFKELAGVTRKNAIPLLEQFDQERLTRREGNLRRILTDDAAR